MKVSEMRFRRVLFISPHYPANHYGGINFYPPMGIAYICETLKQSGVDTCIVDMGKMWPLEYLLGRIEEFRPDLIAISMMTFRYSHHYALVESVKSAFPELPVIAGGPHLTAWKSAVLEQCRSIDYGVSLEGEYTMKELCEGVDIHGIKGLLFREDGQVRFNGERELIADLDRIPFPTYDSIDLTQYYPLRLICSSRGCPYDCIFCQSRSMLGRKFRARTARNIFAEISYWYEKGSRIFNFVDDNFTLNKERIHELCALIRASGLDELDLHASGVRADRVDYDLLNAMKQAGFSHLSFGVESASNAILKVLRKNETIETIEKGVKMARDMGFYVTLYFMVGSPYETLDDVKKSMAFAQKYATGGCNFGSVMPIPDTELMNWVRQNGRLLMEPDYYLNELAEYERVPYFDGPGMTLEEKKTALMISEKVRLRLNRRYRWRKRKNILVSDIRKFGATKALTMRIVQLLLANRHFNTLYSNSTVLKRTGAFVKKRFEL